MAAIIIAVLYFISKKIKDDGAIKAAADEIKADYITARKSAQRAFLNGVSVERQINADGKAAVNKNKTI